MNVISRRRVAGTLIALCLAFLTMETALAQFGITTGTGRSNRSVNEPPKPKTIRGLVEDQGGKPLAGVRVFILDTKTNVTRTATTDGGGLYEMKNLAPDITYDVTAEFKGVSEKKSVSGLLLTRTDNIVDFQLKVAGGAATAAAGDGPRIRTYDGVELRASLDLPSGVPAPIPAVLLLHGYGEDRSVFSALKTKLMARGLAVMALDLRGHGASVLKNGTAIQPATAWRASAQDFPPDIEPALDWLKSQPRVDSKKIAVIGYDIGANLALIASGRYKEIRTVIAVKPNLSESLAMAGSAQDFRPRSALVIGIAVNEETQWKESIVKPNRFLNTVTVNGGASAWFDNQAVVDATFQWLKDTF